MAHSATSESGLVKNAMNAVQNLIKSSLFYQKSVRDYISGYEGKF